jgi:hypothetical protein
VHWRISKHPKAMASSGTVRFESDGTLVKVSQSIGESSHEYSTELESCYFCRPFR